MQPKEVFLWLGPEWATHCAGGKRGVVGERGVGERRVEGRVEGSKGRCL